VPDNEPRPAGRSNRPFIILMFMTPVVIAVIGVLLITTGGPANPQVKLKVPAGYQAVTDPYFGYVVPATWTKDAVYSDQIGDLYYQGRDGWVGESERVRKTSPAPGQLGPTAISTFGLSAPTPYQLVGARPVPVPGCRFAYEYEISRQGVVDAIAIDAWDAATQTEFWLVVHASHAVAGTVLASLTT